MILRQLQDLLGGIYDVNVNHDVYDFLVTDPERLPAHARCESTDETLLVEQGGDDVGVSLYLDRGLLERLHRADPLISLNHGNVADYWTALEGVSHFVYFAWNAGHDKRVSLLELEMQAEVDKYIASYMLLKRQYPDRFPAELMPLLFERTRIDPQLAGDREELYRQASRYAEKFCRRLERSLRNEGEREVLAELRRFYRLADARKVAHIERSG
ncbi:MAG TPA: hypothetical protein VIL32_09580 [Steroidobacteraceae bacterium]